MTKPLTLAERLERNAFWTGVCVGVVVGALLAAMYEIVVQP